MVPCSTCLPIISTLCYRPHSNQFHLPRPPNFIPQRPVLHAPRLLPPIFPPLIRPIRILIAITILQPRQRILQRPRPHIQTQIRQRLRLLAPLHKLICAKLITFHTEPRQFRPLGASRAWPDAILPAVGRDEVPAWVAHNRAAQLFEALDHVGAETGGVDETRGVAGIVESAVDAAAHVSRVVSWGMGL